MNQSKSKNTKREQTLRDSYNRTIDYIRISVTDKCNLKCAYCVPRKKMRFFRKPDVLTYEEIARFVRIASGFGLRKVRITGGEPLMRRNIHSLVSYIKESGIRDVSITTNGVLLGKYALVLKKAGLDRVNISLDTMDAGRYASITQGGDIRSVWEAVHAAEKANLAPVKINVVPIRGLNDDEIESFANLTFEKAFHIRFIEFMPVGQNSFWEKQKSVSSSEVIDRISTLGTLERISFRGRGPSRNFRLRGAKGVIGVISPLTDHFCRVCNRLRLSADGKLRPCLFSNKETDIRTPLRERVPDAEIERLFVKTVQGKPRGHCLWKDPASSDFLESMSKIGG